MEVRKSSFRKIGWIGRASLICCGFWKHRIQKVDFDYSKWLGKDYEKTEKYGTVVLNHTSYLDVYLTAGYYHP